MAQDGGLAAGLAAICSLDHDALRRRMAVWDQVMADALLSRHEAAGSTVLRFATGADLEATLRRLVALERQCCGGARFALEPRSDCLELRIALPD